jgi:predicted AAA+ superfamily ATPase
MLQISVKEIKVRLRFDNPWWENKIGIEQRFNEMPRRLYFKRFFELATDWQINRAIVLMGPRRVGKTVMVFHTIQKLLDRDFSHNSIY